MLENRGLEIIIIAVVVLLLFGAKRLPDSARSLGRSLRILKSEVGAMKSDQPAPEPAQEPEATVVRAPHPLPTAPTAPAVPATQPEPEAQRSDSR